MTECKYDPSKYDPGKYDPSKYDLEKVETVLELKRRSQGVEAA